MTKCTTHTKLRVHFTLLSGIVSCGAVVAFGSGLSNTSATRAEEVAPITAGSDDSAIELPSVGSRLSDDQVAALMQLVLNGIDREYPNKPSNVMIGPESVQSPQQMHPAFFGCFDWHSSVHGHWVLVRLMKEYPELPVAEVARKRLAEHLTQANLQVEADYFLPKDNKSFERMYGWAWALRLVAELHTWDDPDGRQWRDNIRPLESVLVELTRGYLPRLTWPIRTGVHPDTGFALGQILDYARIVGNVALEQAICQKARDFYGSDKNYISSFEPSGEDFFSTSLNEADLMRRVLTQNEFSEWLENFFP
ncbi:MAG: DUF2891 domain-containing protein, partial [Planctomycetales bacterium]|nr:DUF2891 domain-containing protein [Planctomycetales bacterium]